MLDHGMARKCMEKVVIVTLGQKINMQNLRKVFFVLCSVFMFICTLAVLLDMIRNGVRTKHHHFIIVFVVLLIMFFLFTIKQKKSFYKFFLFVISSLMCLNVIYCTYITMHQNRHTVSVQISDMEIDELEKEDIEKIEKMNSFENYLNGYNVRKSDIQTFYQETSKYKVIKIFGKMTNTTDNRIDSWSYCIPLEMFTLWYERRPSDYGKGIEPGETADISVTIIIDTCFNENFIESIFKHIEIFAIAD